MTASQLNRLAEELHYITPEDRITCKGRVTRIHISEILYSVILPKYYSRVSLIISNCFKMLRNQNTDLKILS